MDNIDKIKIKKLIHKMGLKYNMSDEDMKNLLNSPYEFSYEKIKQLDLSNIKTKEDFNKLKTNFIYRSFFKLVIDYKSIKSRNNRIKNINKINNK